MRYPVPVRVTQAVFIALPRQDFTRRATPCATPFIPLHGGRYAFRSDCRELRPDFHGARHGQAPGPARVSSSGPRSRLVAGPVPGETSGVPRGEDPRADGRAGPAHHVPGPLAG